MPYRKPSFDFSKLRALQRTLGPQQLLWIPASSPFSLIAAGDTHLYDLTGFRGVSGSMTLSEQEVVLWVDGRYQKAARFDYDSTLVRLESLAGEKELVDYFARICDRFPDLEILINRKHWEAAKIVEMEAQLGRSLPLREDVDRHFKKATRSAGLEVMKEEEHLAHQRCFKIRSRLAEGEWMLISNPEDIAWMLGARSSCLPYVRGVPGRLLLNRKMLFLSTPADLKESYSMQELKVLSGGDEWRQLLVNIVESGRLQLLKVSTPRTHGSLDYGELEWLRLLLGPRLELHARSMVEHSRIFKTADELESMRSSCRLNAQVMERVIERIHLAVEANLVFTELRVRSWVEQEAAKLGALHPAFPIIVASGSNTACPHHLGDERVISKGDLVMLDIGFYYESGRFATDMTRTIVAGRDVQVPREWRQLATTLAEAFLRQISATFAKDGGFQAKDLDRLGRSLLKPVEKGGYAFCHSTGHGIGIHAHELLLSISPKSRTLLRPMYVYTIEPGIYAQPGGGMWGEMGMRFEDVVHLQENESGLLSHEVLAPSPLDTRLIDLELMRPESRLQFNQYMESCQKLSG